MRTPEQAKIYIEACIDTYIENDLTKSICNHALDMFGNSPASARHHVEYHQKDFGLLIHTAEVLDYCEILGVSMNANTHVLIPAAIIHDVMKWRDYYKKEDGSWDKTDYCQKINHVAGGYAYWIAKTQPVSVWVPFADAIGHCLLSHHGREEWGSPVEPQTLEAMILHFADMLSCNYGGGNER